MRLPVLSSDRLRLEPLCADHLRHEIALDTDPRVMAYVGGPAATPQEVERTHQRRMSLSALVSGLGFWMAFCADDLVGLMMLPPAHGPDQPDDPAVADLGYRLTPAAWGHGYGREGATLLLGHAFEAAGVRRVIAQTRSDNTRSRALLDAVGMNYVREFRSLDDGSDGPLDCEYDLTAQDWSRRRNPQASLVAPRDGAAVTAADLLSAYDAQLRTDAEVSDAEEVALIGPLYLATYVARRRGLITYRDLAGLDRGELDALIATAVAHYEADPRVDRVEWKTRGHDRPADLLARLAQHGFVAEERETVMLGEASAVVAADSELPTGYTLVRAASEAEIRSAESVAARVFATPGEPVRSMADELVRRFSQDPDSFELWAVLNPAGEPVCTGRVEFVDGTEFAGLWGGACDTGERGRGLYRALTAARARSALGRGKRYVQSDCTEYSRPILERAGLVAATTSTPAIWRRG